MEQFRCAAPVDFTVGAFKRVMRDTLAMLLVDSFHFLRFHPVSDRENKAAEGCAQ